MVNLKAMLKDAGALDAFVIRKTEVEFKGVGKAFVYVKELPDTLLDSILNGGHGAVEKEQRLVRAGVCNEAGGAIFTDKEIEILRRNYRVPLALAVMRINFPQPAEQEEDLGNSESVEPNGSGTLSLSDSDEQSPN